MNSNYPTKNILREYLLNRLSDQPQRKEELSEQMVFDDELSRMVDLVEDEILEEYLEGALSPADAQAVKEHFLRPQERKDKLQFVHLLQKHLEAHPPEPVSPPEPLPPWRGNSATVPLRSHFRTYIEMATLLMLGFSFLLYLEHVRRGVQSSISDYQSNLKRLEGKLEEDRHLYEGLAQILLPKAILSFGESDRSRGPGLKILRLRPSTQVIKIEIERPQAKLSDSFDIAIKDSAGNVFWSQAEVHPSADELLSFGFSPQGMVPEDYKVAITPHGKLSSQAEDYNFRLKVAK